MTLERINTKHEAAGASRRSKLAERDDPAWNDVPGHGLHCHPLAASVRRVDRPVVHLSILDPLKEKRIKSQFPVGVWISGQLTVTMKSLYMSPAPPLDSILTEEQQTTKWFCMEGLFLKAVFYLQLFSMWP